VSPFAGNCCAERAARSLLDLGGLALLKLALPLLGFENLSPIVL